MFKILFVLFLAIFYVSCSNLNLDQIECQNDTQCPSDTICESNHCILKKDIKQCDKDSNCTNTEYCDIVIHYCRDNTCNIKSDCPNDKYCNKDKVCEASCKQKSDCAENETCNEGECISECNNGNGCNTDKHEICAPDAMGGGDSSYSCICEAGYEPKNGNGECVEITINTCQDIYCDNATCKVLNDTDYECVCNEGYIHVDENITSPCVECLTDENCHNNKKFGDNYYCNIFNNAPIDNKCEANTATTCTVGEKRCSADGKSVEECNTTGNTWRVTACETDEICNVTTFVCEPAAPQLYCPPHSIPVEASNDCTCVQGYQTADSNPTTETNPCNPINTCNSEDYGIKRCSDDYTKVENCNGNNWVISDTCNLENDKICDEHDIDNITCTTPCENMSECTNSSGVCHVSTTGGGSGQEVAPECFCSNGKVNDGPKCNDAIYPSPCYNNDSTVNTVCGDSSFATCRKLSETEYMCICKTGYKRKNDNLSSICIPITD